MNAIPDPAEDRPRGAPGRRRLILFAAPWLVLAAALIAGGVMYSRRGDDAAPASANAAPAAKDQNDESSGIVKALESQGIDLGEAATPVTGALAQGTIGDGIHDKGKQPTFTQIATMSAGDLLSLFPANTVTADDLPLLKEQVEQVRAVAERLGTVEAAKAAGYTNTTSDVPFMGEHYLNFDLVRKGVFDPARPQGLLFSKIGPGGSEQLVGVWFLLLPGINGTRADAQPASFAGDLAIWHAHVGLCLVGFSGASEGESRDSCKSKGGSFTPDLRWMMHVWVAPGHDNPDGIFTYLNRDLFEKQQAASAAADPPTGQAR